MSDDVDTVGYRLNRTQKALVRQILQLYVPCSLANCDSQVKLRIRIDKYLRELVKKLYPILLTGGIRLVGSCAGLVLNKRPFNIAAINDIDITILVSEEVDFNQVFHHQQNILRQALSLGSEDHIQLLDSIRVSNEQENWSLFSFGQVEPRRRHLDIRVSSKMSRSFVFAHDSFEIIIDPLVVSGIKHEPLFAFSRFGDFFSALTALDNSTLIMPEPNRVHNGLLRYAIALIQGYQVGEGIDREALERLLVATFLSQTRSLDHTKALINKTARKHLFSNEYSDFQHLVANLLSSQLKNLLLLE